MWWKKKEQVDYSKLFNTILEALKIAERRLSSLEIEVDALKTRLRRKIMPSEDESLKEKDIYRGMLLPE